MAFNVALVHRSRPAKGCYTSQTCSCCSKLSCTFWLLSGLFCFMRALRWSQHDGRAQIMSPLFMTPLMSDNLKFVHLEQYHIPQIEHSISPADIGSLSKSLSHAAHANSPNWTFLSALLFWSDWLTAGVLITPGGGGGGGGGTRSENCWGCAVGHWNLDPKRSRGNWYFGAKKIEFCEDLYPKDRFCVGGWEKIPQKDRVWYPEGQKRGSKPRHICITHYIGSTPPGITPPLFTLATKMASMSSSSGAKLLPLRWLLAPGTPSRLDMCLGTSNQLPTWLMVWSNTKTLKIVTYCIF